MLTQNKITLPTLLLNYFIKLFQKPTAVVLETPLPNNIGEYSLVKKITENLYKNTYTFAIYKDPHENQVFVKGWTGHKEFDSNYLMLKNEALAYKVLSEIKQNSELTVPKYIGEIENTNSYYLIVEYIQIESIAIKSISDQIKLYERAIKYLQSAYNSDNHKFDKLFSKRTFFMYSLLLPIIGAKAILNHPKHVKLITKALVIYYLNLLQTGKITYTLSHRDLDFQHISQTGKQYYLLDLETVAIAPDLHDYANTLRTIWNKTELRNAFIKNIENKFKDMKSYKSQFICQSIENAIHHMSGDENEEVLVKNCTDMLNYFTNYTRNKKFLYFCRSILFNTFYTLSKPFNKKTSNILCYHNISSESNFYSISKDEFLKQLDKIGQKDNFASISNLIDFNSKTNRINISFDDGFKDLLQIVPELSKRNIPTTLFVLSDPENADRKELDNKSPLLTLEEVKQLSLLPNVTIGCHTATHRVLTTLSDEDLKKEIIDSKVTLEKALNKPIDYIAYPKGQYNDKVIEFVKKAGYKAAFSVDPGSIDKSANNWALPRYIIDKTHDVSEFPAIYSPSTGMLKKFLNKFQIWERFLQ